MNPKIAIITDESHEYTNQMYAWGFENEYTMDDQI